MVTIKVFSRLANATVRGKKVRLSTGKGTLEAVTNSSGEVGFDVPSGKYTVYIDGARVHDGSIVGVQIVYVK